MRYRFSRFALAAVATVGLLSGTALTATQALANTPSSYTWQDDSLQANTPFNANSVELGAPSSLPSANVTTSVFCSGGFMSGQPLSVTPTSQGGLKASLGTNPECNSATLSVSTPTALLTPGVYTFDVSASPNPDHNATETAVETVIVSGTPARITQVSTESVTAVLPPNTVYPNIKFTGKDYRYCTGYVNEGGIPLSLPSGAASDPCGYDSAGTALTTQSPNPQGLIGTWATTDLPAGIGFSTTTSGLLVPGTAVPGTYDWATVSDSENGATASETFVLSITGHKVYVYVPGNLGDEVNPFGNGFDVYQQHYTAGAIIAGWTATKGDPATHFVREATSTTNGYRYEAVRADGIASGLCVSDPGGGWGSDPLADGLILTAGACSSNFGIFVNQADGTVKNAVTGLYVSPAGTGAQLRGTTAPTPWGGSKYTWTDLKNLP